MTDVDSPRVVTPRELLDIRERDWRRKLATASLVAEVLDGIPLEYREQALEVLGGLYQRQATHEARARILRRWPAVHVVCTTGVAAEYYARGTFWPKLAKLIERSNDQTLHKEWGRAFLRNLGVLDLPSFASSDADAGSRYVGRILLHAGVPTYCLGDYYTVLARRSHADRGLTAEDFVAWAASRAASTGLVDVDMPVQRFLRYGDEYAVDVTDRVLDLLDTVSRGGDATQVPLPQRFLDAAVEFHQQGRGHVVTADGGGASPGNPRPSYVLSPFGSGVLLRLPPVGDAPDGRAVWSVSFDGETKEVGTQAYVPGSGEPSPQTDVVVPRPVRLTTVSLAGREDLALSLPFVDADEALLAFDDDGTLIPGRMPLPAAPLWLLFPGEVGTVVIDGDGELLTESPLPPGWAGWSLLQVDLTHATGVSIGEVTRTVRSRAVARIDVDPPVTGIWARGDLPVHAAPPRITIPTSLAQAQWVVTLADADGDVVARWSGEPESSDPNSVWQQVPRPLVGTFTVRVRGPWGRGASRAVTIVEGLSMRCTPSWRRFTEEGLQPATAQLTAPGLEIARPQVDLAQEKRETQVRIGASGNYRTLVVRPPHMTVAYQSAVFSINPTVRPLRLTREELIADPGSVVLHLGIEAQPELHVLTPAGVLQSVRPSDERAGVFRFDLAKIVDTLDGVAQAQLALSQDGELVVGVIRPQRLFSDIAVDNGALRLQDCEDLDGLEAGVYLTRAPWVPPVVVPIREGQALLPDSHQLAGPLRVLVRVSDPWAPEPIPSWPEHGGDKLVDNSGHLWDLDDHEATALSSYLAGAGPFPDKVSDFGRLWAILGRLPSLGLGERAADVNAAVDEALRSESREALLALMTSEMPTTLIPHVVVRSGLVRANLEQAHHDEAPRWTPATALPAALLSAADSEWSLDEIEAATMVCGGTVQDLLNGEDPHAASGRFDASADLYDDQPALRDPITRAAGLVPKALLDPDTRVLAGMQLIRERRHPRLKWLVSHAHRVLAEAERMVARLEDPVAESAFVARQHRSATGGWRVIPAISMAYALVARHAARGHRDAARWMDRQTRVWADLALVAPQLVTIDIILAELLVAGSPAHTQMKTNG